MIEGKFIVALCISRVSDETCQGFIKKLSETLNKQNGRLFVYCTSTDLFSNILAEQGERSIFALMDYSVIDAVVIFDEKIKSQDIKERIITRARAAKKPVFILDGEAEDCISLKFDYAYGMRQVIRHVLDEKQIKDVQFMAGIKGNYFSEIRTKTFIEEMKKRNLPVHDNMISYGDFWSRPTEIATEKLISEKRVPKAFICANDVMAITVCFVLKKHGYRIPEDVVVTGFDGIEESYYSTPNITSCFCNYENVAEKIGELFKAYNQGQKLGNHYTVLPSLILSESTGCPRAKQIHLAEYLRDINNRFYRYQEEARDLMVLSVQIESSYDIKQAAKYLQNPVLFDLYVFLRKEVIDETVNPLKIKDTDSFEEQVCLFYDTNRADDFEPCDFNTREVIPDLEANLERGYPLIFAPLNFMHISLGYVCFHFQDYELVNYYKIFQSVNALNTAIGGFRNMRYQKYLNEQIEELYKSDSLTGLYNRRGFGFAFGVMKAKARVKNQPLTIVLVDLDGLKNINDQYGHDEGDNAIKVLARALKSTFSERALCTRFGGDEMMAITDEDCDTDAIREKLLESLKSYNVLSGKAYEVSASMGIYVTDNEESLDFEDLLRKVDVLMYEEKKNKKHR